MRLIVTKLATMSVVAAMLAGSPNAWAQSNNGLKATVGIETLVNRPTGRSSGSGVSTEFVPGEMKRLNVTAGMGGDLCVTGVFASEDGTFPPAMQARIDKQQADSLYVWSFDITMVEVATDRIVFDASWQRISRTAPNDPLRGKQRITLREGQSHPIDLIHGEQSSECLGVVLDVIAYIQDPPALQIKTLEWDLWLTGPQAAPVHRALTSPQGESAPFQFEPVSTTTTPAGATVHVYGQLRGRVRADGNIDVALVANRMVNTGQGPSRISRVPRGFNSGNSGQKNFVLTPGEAIKIVLPPLSPAGTGKVQIRKDPVTGEMTTTLVARPFEVAGTPAAGEMSITVQARVR